MPDGDLVHEIKYWIQVSPFQFIFKHVKGHQDDIKSYQSLSPLAKLNVKMDKMAKSALDDITQNTEIPPFLIHSGISLRSQYGRITSNFQEEILQQYIGINAENQFMKTFRITYHQMKIIDWKNFKRFTKSNKIGSIL